MNMSRQGRPVGLIIAVVAVSAAALLLWMIMRSGDDGASANPPSQPGPGPGPAASSRVPSRKDGDDRPGIPQVAAADQDRRGGDRPPATETVINGVRIRDHRKDRSQPVTLPDRPPPSHPRRISPNVTAAVIDRMRPVVRECAANVPPEAKGVKPRAEGQVLISIKDHQVHVREAALEIGDVVGAAVEPTRQCIRERSLAVTAPGGDEEDVEDYPIHLSFGL
jgi:hypothetical protein